MKRPSFGRRLLTRWMPAVLGGFVVVTFVAALVTYFRSGDDLTPFASDGCSLFPDGTSEDKTLWRHCCVAHDYAYWQGGTSLQRAVADEQLNVCVADAGEAGTGRLMLAGVRVGGLPWWPTPFRWGFGWPYPRGYGELTADELEKVKAMSGDDTEL